MTDTVEKVFWGSGTKFSRAADAFRAQRCEGPRGISEKRPQTFASALRRVPTAAVSKNQQLRDFWRRTIFDFFNTIGQKQRLSRKYMMSASLIGRLGSSTFRLSTCAVSMSLTGSRFSTESAPGPLYGAFFVKEIWQGALFFFASFFVRSEGRFFVPIRTSLESARAGAVKVGRRANLARHTPPFPGHTLTASSTTAPLGAVRTMTIRGGARLRARINRATTLYSVGPRTRTMMQSCASAAKLRSGGPILPFGMKAKGPLGIPPPRTVIGALTSVGTRPKLSGFFQRPPFIGPDAKRHRPGQRPVARAATGRSKACAPRPRSWACEYRERPRCGL